MTKSRKAFEQPGGAKVLSVEWSSGPEERVWRASQYVAYIVRDGGIYSGEYLGHSHNGAVIVVADCNRAQSFPTRAAARAFCAASADPERCYPITIEQARERSQ